MSDEQIIIDSGYRTMMVLNSILLTVVGILFGAVAWYFKKDYESHKGRIDRAETHIEKILMEMQADRERERGQIDMMKNMIKILAKKTNIEVGL